MVTLTYNVNKDPPYKDTKVPLERTKAEIEILLKMYGVKGIRWTTLEGQDDTLEFLVESTVRGVKKQFAIAVKPPMIPIKKRVRTSGGWKNAETRNPNQEYRLLFYWIKSKIEAITWGLTTVEQEFLSQITTSLPDGRVTSIGEIVADLMVNDNLNALPYFGDKSPPKRPTDKSKIIDVEPSG